jgi:23S rRNA (guanine2445-N2)-methyltransferase / 23S rRNA (guanine2069-N7)-methyltransferase
LSDHRRGDAAAGPRFVATVPAGMGDLLEAELRDCGATDISPGVASVGFSGSLAVAYRVCLWSRVANRVLLPLTEFEVTDADDLYAAALAIDWSEHLGPRETLAVSAVLRGTVLTHSHYAALRVKDAVCDQLRETTGDRPMIDTDRPDVRLYLHVDHARAELGIDLSGDSLHRRGYRIRSGPAPIKENLAAALLLRCGWPAEDDQNFIDLMCGTGTFLIEAAWMASDRAPGLGRLHWGFSGWRGHDEAAWKALRAEADERAAVATLTRRIIGRDHDPRAIESARGNIGAVRLGSVIELEQQSLGTPRPAVEGLGLVFANPPYGERLGQDPELLQQTYRSLGEVFRRDYPGWRAAVLSADPLLNKYLELRARRVNRFHNGDLDCQLLRFEVSERWYFTRPLVPDAERHLPPPVLEASPGAVMFANRVRKNLKTLGGWAARAGVDCYRLYDADMPEYAVAIDLYRGEELWVQVQEYAPPASIPAERAEQRLRELLSVLPEVLGVRRENLHLKRRQRQRGDEQYQRMDAQGEFHCVREGAARLWVNFTDYLDTGLFLDHRLTRAHVATLSSGRHLLNLYAYTGVATVQAGLAGAVTTTSVDLSRTYLAWAERNLHENNLGGPSHRLIAADCAQWLREQRHRRQRWGVIFLDPPTFSNSKRMDGTLDIQRDHIALIQSAMELLEPDGVLVFSNNFRRFQLDAEALQDVAIREISAATIPPDFQRNPRIHRCWELRWV